MAHAKGGLRVSVVINTYNRGPSLRNTLHALRYQTHEDFEVVVVNGPSTDDTPQVLAEFDGVRVASCPEVHLCKSRNVGIDEAAGDIVAFIDDDALPEPTWLEELVAAYDSDHVGGAGGIVWDHTGFRHQYQYSVCDRLGTPEFNVAPPLDRYLVPGADPCLYLQGTNASFRRQCLVEIGGFDEEIEYYLDEVDVCRRVIDAGYLLCPLAGAAVHHKYLASHRRTSQKVILDPFPNVKNYCYLLMLTNRDTRPLDELRAVARFLADGVKEAGWAYFTSGKFTEVQRDRFLARVTRGLHVGVEKGLTAQRLHRTFAPAESRQFRPFGVLKPRRGRLKVCFVSQEYPPGDFGGIGRFTADLATGFAAVGHEVHVVTRSPDIHRVDFEEGVWLHRLPAAERSVDELDGAPLAGNLFNSTAVYQEVRRIHERCGLDVVSAPLWACEGLVCALDERFPTVLTLMTSMNTIAAMHPSWGGAEWVQQLIVLERTVARQARFLHPISKAILATVDADCGGVRGRAEVQPLGVRDRRDRYPRRRAGDDGDVRVLFVGRLERRKGVDVLLQAALRLLARFPQVEFVLAGKDTPNTETGTTYREQFEREHGRDPSVAGRVTFAGAVSEDELYQHYADADIVCMPSRYESFGLVLVEGMMFGKPVVGCAVGGMVEIVEEGGNGLLAKPGDPDSLAECQARLIGDTELRRRYGARSRQLFEERFALPLVVENTARFYAAVAAEHRQKKEAAAGPVVEQLAAVLTDVAKLAPEVATRAAEGLLDPASYPIDSLAVVRKLWPLPDREFLTGLYNLLWNRELDDAGVAHFLPQMRAGAPREHIVRLLAESQEAREVGRSMAWLDRLRPGAAREPARVSEVPRELPRPPGRLKRIWHKFRSIAAPRKVLRYVKRAVYMPWNFQTFTDHCVQSFAETAEGLAHIRATHAEGLAQVQQVLGMLTMRVRDLQRKQDVMEGSLDDALWALTVEGREHARGLHEELARSLEEVRQALPEAAPRARRAS